MPLGKYKEARLSKDAVCLVFLNTDRLSSQVAEPSFILMNDAVLATPFHLHLLFWLLESQQCRGQLSHTMARLLVFVETGFHYVLLVSLALPAHGFQLSCNQINCLLFYFLFHLFFTVCTVLHGGHRTTCRISCFLPRCGPRTVEEFVWFSCVVSPRLGYLPKPVGLRQPITTDAF